MYTSVIGFPRVGSLRELKFATEKYFRKEIDAIVLDEVGRNIRKEQWELLAKKGIDFIPSNDFSFYDNVLDAALLFDIVPARYKVLDLPLLDTYFAMARGYQGEHGDVRALAMKKWFNTNYHYMVPEFEDDIQIQLVGSKPFDAYIEAKTQGVETKPVLVGAFTLLKLLRFTGNKRARDIVDDIVKAYIAYIERFKDLDVKWLAFDEPYLVRDLDSEDIALFKQIYDEILKSKGSIKILLQTYFGDVRDAYTKIANLDFDGIGLDFIEGKETAHLIKNQGFPANKILFAGIVNGKNIWRNSYQKSLEVIKGLQEAGIDVVLSTSCSLLHVPYTLENENKLGEGYKNHFAFAKEKLDELAELKVLAEDDKYQDSTIFKQNVSLFTSREGAINMEVQVAVSAIKESDFTRLPVFEEREKLQKGEFALPFFPTTTIGSFPQTVDVKANRKAYKSGEISEEAYIDFNKQKIASCVALQEEIGLDVLVHGEYERNDMVEYFGEQLHGYVFTEKAWVQSYGTRCVKPPIIWGDVSRIHPMTVSWSCYAQSLTNKPMKAMLTGPVTILNWSFPREDISIKESTYQIALAIRDEVLDLEANGIRVIQIDEAALREKLPLRKSDWYSAYLDWAIPAFRLVHSKVKAETQIHTHMCYSEFTDIIKAIDNMDADVITFEASRSDLAILQSLNDANFKTQVGPGVYDIHSPRVPSVEELKQTAHNILKKVDSKKLWINPDCGLKTRGEKETVESLKNLVETARELRREYQS